VDSRDDYLREVTGFKDFRVVKFGFFNGLKQCKLYMLRHFIVYTVLDKQLNELD
jgi:hypothetical protein